jgi:hypothetical protein
MSSSAHTWLSIQPKRIILVVGKSRWSLAVGYREALLLLHVPGTMTILVLISGVPNKKLRV